MAFNVTIIFQNGTRETFNNVDEATAMSKSRLREMLVKRYNDPNIMDKVVDVKREPVATAPAAPTPTPNEANVGHYGDKNRWRNLGGGYWHNVDTNQVQLR